MNQTAPCPRVADEVNNLKTSTATVNDLRHPMTSFAAMLDQLQAAAARLDTVISNLRAAVQDFVEGAVDNSKRALETVRPLLSDSLWRGGQASGTAQAAGRGRVRKTARPAIEDDRHEIRGGSTVFELMAHSECAS